jgi:hypothetical protein
MEGFSAASILSSRKAELVLELIKGHKTIADAAREHDFKQGEIQK